MYFRNSLAITYRRVLEGPSRRQEGRERGCAPPSLCLHLALDPLTPALSLPPSLSGHEGAWCRASLVLHRRLEGRPRGLQQHHDEPGRRRGAGVAPHDVHIARPLVERLPCRERDGRMALQLHDDRAFEYV